MDDIKQSYLNVMKNVLTDYNRIDLFEYKPLLNTSKRNWKVQIMLLIDKIINRDNYYICSKIGYIKEDRENGRDWPTYAETMIGLKRLNNIEHCIKDTVKNNIEGDLIETGVWRGGATVFMKAVLKSLEVTNKVVWVADSFEGLPKPDERYAADKSDTHYKKNALAISLEYVKNNFKKYDLLDENVKFLKGWFKDTLPTAPINKLSVLRLDGDMYSSTMDALVSLYPKLSIGGYIIIDDWGAVPACKQAVVDYRTQHGISEQIIDIDWASVYWKKLQ